MKKSIILSRQYSSQKDRKKMWPARVQHASIFLPFPSIILKMNGSQYQPVIPPLPSLRAVKQNFLLQSHYHVSPEEETWGGKRDVIPQLHRLLWEPRKMTTHTGDDVPESFWAWSWCLLPTATKKILAASISSEWKLGLWVFRCNKKQSLPKY